MRALQRRVCRYDAADNEEIHQIISPSPERYIMLISREGEWLLKEFSAGAERSRLLLRNLFSTEYASFTDSLPLLFSSGTGDFCILAGTNLFCWDSMGARPSRSTITASGGNALCFSYPVQAVRALSDGSLLLIRRHIFALSQFYSIAERRDEGYAVVKPPMSLNPEDFRCSGYIAVRPCFCDVAVRGDEILIHTPGSIRDFGRFDPECSLLIRMNREGQILGCREVEPGWGYFSSDGSSLVIRPLRDEGRLFFSSLSEDASLSYETDRYVEWSPAAAESRYLFTGRRIAAWTGGCAILSEICNPPRWLDEPVRGGIRICG